MQATLQSESLVKAGYSLLGLTAYFGIFPLILLCNLSLALSRSLVHRNSGHIGPDQGAPTRQERSGSGVCELGSNPDFTACSCCASRQEVARALVSPPSN